MCVGSIDLSSAGNGWDTSVKYCVDENEDGWYCDDPNKLTAAQLFAICSRDAGYVTSQKDKIRQQKMLLDTVCQLRDAGINVDGDIGTCELTSWLHCEAVGDGLIKCYVLTADRLFRLQYDLLIEAGKWVFLQMEWARPGWIAHRISATNIGQFVYFTDANEPRFGTSLVVVDRYHAMNTPEVMERLRYMLNHDLNDKVFTIKEDRR